MSRLYVRHSTVIIRDKMDIKDPLDIGIDTPRFIRFHWNWGEDRLGVVFGAVWTRCANVNVVCLGPVTIVLRAAWHPSVIVALTLQHLDMQANSKHALVGMTGSETVH